MNRPARIRVSKEVLAEYSHLSMRPTLSSYPRALEFLIDVESIASLCLPDELLSKFIRIFKLRELKTSKKMREELMAELGRSFLETELWPVESYFS